MVTIQPHVYHLPPTKDERCFSVIEQRLGSFARVRLETFNLQLERAYLRLRVAQLGRELLVILLQGGDLAAVVWDICRCRARGGNLHVGWRYGRLCVGGGGRRLARDFGDGWCDYGR